MRKLAKLFLPPPPAVLQDHSNNSVIEPLRERLREQSERVNRSANEMRECARRIVDLAKKSDDTIPLIHNGHVGNSKS